MGSRMGPASRGARLRGADGQSPRLERLQRGVPKSQPRRLGRRRLQGPDRRPGLRSRARRNRSESAGDRRLVIRRRNERMGDYADRSLQSGGGGGRGGGLAGWILKKKRGRRGGRVVWRAPGEH